MHQAFQHVSKIISFSTYTDISVLPIRRFNFRKTLTLHNLTIAGILQKETQDEDQSAQQHLYATAGHVMMHRSQALSMLLILILWSC